MAIAIGTTSISSIAVGNTSVSTIAVGNTSMFSSGGSSGTPDAPTALTVADYPGLSSNTLGITWLNSSTAASSCNPPELVVTNMPTASDVVRWKLTIGGTVTNPDGRAANNYQSESATVGDIETFTSETGTITTGSSTTGLQLRVDFDISETRTSGSTDPNVGFEVLNYFALSDGSFSLKMLDDTDINLRLTWTLPTDADNDGYILQYKEVSPGSTDWATFTTLTDGTATEFSTVNGAAPHLADDNAQYKYRIIAFKGITQATPVETTAAVTYNPWSHAGSINNLANTACGE